MISFYHLCFWPAPVCPPRTPIDPIVKPKSNTMLATLSSARVLTCPFYHLFKHFPLLFDFAMLHTVKVVKTISLLESEAQTVTSLLSVWVSKCIQPADKIKKKLSEA